MHKDDILHVLHFMNAVALGGAELQAVSLIDRTPMEKYSVSALVFAENKSNLLTNALQERGIPVYTTLEQHRILEIGNFRRLISILRHQTPDLLHIHNSYFHASPYLPAVARLAGIRRVIVTEQSNHPVCPSSFGVARKWLMSRMVDMTIAVSNAVRDTLINKYHFPTLTVRVIRNAVDVNTIANRVTQVDLVAMRESFGFSPEEVIVGTVANLRHEKGVNYLVDSIPLILQVLPNVRLIVLGEGDQRTEIETIIQNHGLVDRVILKGWCADVVPVLAIMDVFVLPSVIEGFPLTILEAMAAGRPIVATAVGGTPEAITDHQTGILVPPADVPALAKAIIEVLTHRDLAEKIRRNSQAEAVSKHGTEAMMKSYLALYRESN